MNLQQRLKHYRLSEQEYELICKKLGRSPQGVEWAIFSALWSEHCSYKSSRVHLKKFSFSSPYVLESFGENAGVIDLGQGERIAFKMESHNHPSFIEPYEGAATGVGGILRDIFTMGARPLALANYLCFGSPEKMAPWLDGVVRGIGGYGNCVGVPTVTGQTEFHSSYDKNILVNAFALGYFGKNQPVFTSQARGVGNYVVYVGAKTGRDGVHGASMASESFDDKSEEKKPTIQKGDPFYEKLLIEACLEVMSQNWVEAIQDMGAAGLTSSSFEMASKGRVGLSLHLDKVPLRDPHMTPEDILLSESQERMLLICQPQNFKALSEVFFKWDLDAVIIGEVQENETVDLYWRGELLTSLSPKWVVDEAPLYERPYKKPPQKRAPFSKLEVEDELKTLFSMLKSAQGSGRQWVYRQFDQRVGGRTVFAGGEPVAVLCLPESKRYLGIVLGCRPYLMRWDVEVGAKDAIFYPALCLAVKGMRPLAVTDCLNFGNPEKEEIMGELVTSIEAMSEACQFLSTPVISGNVSLYNETLGKNITPTPAVGMVGLGEKMPPPSVFQSEGEQVFLVYKTFFQTTGLYGEKVQGEMRGNGQFSPEISSFVEKLTRLSQLPYVKATRVVGRYGLLYALARMCTSSLGGDFQLPKGRGGFEEYLYEVVFSVVEAEAFKKELEKEGIDFYTLGHTQKTFLSWERGKVSCDELLQAYETGWEQNFENLD